MDKSDVLETEIFQQVLAQNLDRIGKREVAVFMEQQRERMVEKCLWFANTTYAQFQQMSQSDRFSIAQRVMQGFSRSMLQVVVAFALGMGEQESALRELFEATIVEETASPSVVVKQRSHDA